MINIKFDMLQIKKDRLQEVKKQIIKYAKVKKWDKVYPLRAEEKKLKEEIKLMEVNRSGR